MDHLTKKDGINGVNVTNNLRLALAYFTVIRQNTSSGLLQQGKYRGRQICENMLNFLTAVVSPCKSTQPQQAEKLLLKTTPGADCPLSSGQKKRENSTKVCRDEASARMKRLASKSPRQIVRLPANV